MWQRIVLARVSASNMAIRMPRIGLVIFMQLLGCGAGYVERIERARAVNAANLARVDRQAAESRALAERVARERARAAYERCVGESRELAASVAIARQLCQNQRTTWQRCGSNLARNSGLACAAAVVATVFSGGTTAPALGACIVAGGAAAAISERCGREPVCDNDAIEINVLRQHGLAGYAQCSPPP